MKKLLQLFGLLDIITLVRGYKQIIPQTIDWTNFPLITTADFLLYASFIFSAYFLLRKSKVGLWLTYGQFPLRLAFVVLSFGFLFSINHFFKNHADSYRIIFWILVALEILRLIITIQIHRIYFSIAKAAII